jgi:hypothetical protein
LMVKILAVNCCLVIHKVVEQGACMCSIGMV